MLERFADKISKNPKTEHMLPRNEPNPSLRKQEKFKVEFARTTRMAKSPINAMAHLLNKNYTWDKTSKKLKAKFTQSKNIL